MRGKGRQAGSHIAIQERPDRGSALGISKGWDRKGLSQGDKWLEPKCMEMESRLGSFLVSIKKTVSATQDTEE